MKKRNFMLAIFLTILTQLFATGLTNVSLYSPANNETHIDTTNVILEWYIATDTSGEKVTYDLYFGTDADPALFRSNLDPTLNSFIDGIGYEWVVEGNNNGKATGRYVNYGDTLISGITYYWKLVAKNESGDSTFSDIYSFSTLRSNTLPTQPTLLSPANGAINTTSYPTFRWTQSTDIDGDTTTYCIYLKKEGENFNYLASTRTDTSYTISSQLKDFTTYYWRVHAMDGVSWGDVCSITSSFTVENYINDAPVMGALKTPSNGAKNLGFYPIKFKWTASEIDNEPLKYDVYADQNTNPTTLIAENISEDSLVSSFDQYGSYYWKVVVKDTSGLSDTSAIHSFSCWEQAPDFVPEMADVKDNEFDMGTADSIYYWTSYFCDGRDVTMKITNEYPQHHVILDDYQIGKYEITNEQYCKFLNTLAARGNTAIIESSNCHRIKSFPYRNVTFNDTILCQVFDMTRSLADRDSVAYEEMYDSPIMWNGTDFEMDTNFTNHPVRFMSYKGAEIFAKWAGNYRLPTEAEWENAAMGGSQSKGYKYSGSNDYNEVAVHGEDECTSTVDETTQPVGSLKPNELDIYDMSGNAEEICADYYSNSYYANSPTHNPKNTTEETWGYVLRNGGYNIYDSVYFRVKYRNHLISSKCGKDAGFRLAKTIDYYTITFNDWDGTTLKIDTVEYEATATAPTDPIRSGYTFTGWDTDFSKVTADLIVTAQYSIRTYTVTFNDWDGATLKIDTVEYEASATAPTDPTRSGYIFTGWDTDFSKVTADITVTAQYSPLTNIENTNKKAGINIYPNPAENNLIIEIENITLIENSEKGISIFNCMGEKIYNDIKLETKQEIDISKYSKGVYFVTVGNEIKKIIKE